MIGTMDFSIVAVSYVRNITLLRGWDKSRFFALFILRRFSRVFELVNFETDKNLLYIFYTTG